MKLFKKEAMCTMDSKAVELWHEQTNESSHDVTESYIQHIEL